MRGGRKRSKIYYINWNWPQTVLCLWFCNSWRWNFFFASWAHFHQSILMYIKVKLSQAIQRNDQFFLIESIFEILQRTDYLGYQISRCNAKITKYICGLITYLTMRTFTIKTPTFLINFPETIATHPFY